MTLWWPLFGYATNFDQTVHASDKDRLEGDALAAEEKHILRCLGAAVIMQWNNIPKKLQRELFDSAGVMMARPTTRFARQWGQIPQAHLPLDYMHRRANRSPR
jgi:hypothetical protein